MGITATHTKQDQSSQVESFLSFLWNYSVELQHIRGTSDKKHAQLMFSLPVVILITREWRPQITSESSLILSCDTQQLEGELLHFCC